MAPQSVKRKKPPTQAGFVRQTMHSDRLEGILKIPHNLKHRMVEVILLSFDDDTAHHRDKKAEGSSLKKFAGAWAGDMLVREDQGTYEVREELK
ncbi:MAG: hypothetical protein ABIJ44_07275 [Pseudomonadota bacterium]